MNESDTRLKLIDPALKRSWDFKRQTFTEYYFTDGEIIVRGHMTVRKKPKKADYLLMYVSDVLMAVVESKDTSHAVGAGMQQAMGYASSLDVPFTYSTNGKGFLEHDFTTGKERRLAMDDFPTPDELWGRYRVAHGIQGNEAAQTVTTPFYYETGDVTSRYYQRIAVNRTVEAIARGQRRVLLVMATGTGKTYTAFQIVHRCRSAPGGRPRPGARTGGLQLGARICCGQGARRAYRARGRRRPRPRIPCRRPRGI